MPSSTRISCDLSSGNWDSDSSVEEPSTAADSPVCSSGWSESSVIIQSTWLCPPGPHC